MVNYYVKSNLYIDLLQPSQEIKVGVVINSGCFTLQAYGAIPLTCGIKMGHIRGQFVRFKVLDSHFICRNPLAAQD